MKITFSVIIPTLNEEKYLPLILSDLAKQKEKNFEVVVVDGKSQDKTKEVAQSFAPKMPLTFLEVDKRNVSYQRNTGAAKAKGDYFVFLDADSRVPSDFTSASEAVCKRGAKVILPTILPDDKTQKTKVLISLVNTLIKLSQTYGKPLSGGGNFIIEKGLFNELHGFDEDLFMSEDHDLIRRAWAKGVKARIAKSVKVTNSMRRGDVEGDMSLIYKYVVGFLAYTVVPSNKALKAKLFDYEMGGHRYKENGKGKTQKAKLKRKIDIDRLRQLLQLSAILAMLRYWKMW